MNKRTHKTEWNELMLLTIDNAWEQCPIASKRVRELSALFLNDSEESNRRTSRPFSPICIIKPCGDYFFRTDKEALCKELKITRKELNNCILEGYVDRGPFENCLIEAVEDYQEKPFYLPIVLMCPDGSESHFDSPYHFSQVHSLTRRHLYPLLTMQEKHITEGPLAGYSVRTTFCASQLKFK